MNQVWAFMQIKKMVGSEHGLKRQKKWSLSNIQCVRVQWLKNKEKEHPMRDANILKVYPSGQFCIVHFLQNFTSFYILLQASSARLWDSIK